MMRRETSKQDKSVFIDDESIDRILSSMEENDLLDTSRALAKDSEGSLRLVGFHERHTNYLKMHPNVNPQHYLANIRTMIRIRTEK
jgi:hypothetical protein